MSKNKKEIEVNSIRIISDDEDNENMSNLRKVDFDLNGKQKEEIEITISPERIAQLKREQKRKEAEERARLKKEARLKAKENKKLKKSQREKAKEKGEIEEMPEFLFINVGVVLIVAVAIIFSLYFLQRSSGVSEYENRELYTFPEFSVESYFDGSFTQGITNYFTDTVPNRDKLKQLCNSFKGLLGFSSSGSSIIGSGGADIKHEEFEGEITTPKVTIYIPSTDNTGTSDNSSSTTPQSSEALQSTTTPSTSKPVTNDKPNVGGEALENGILVINKGTDEVRAMELYGGGFAAGKEYALTLNRYREDLVKALDGKVNVYSMSIPMAVAYYLPKDFQNQSASIPDNIKNINSYLDGVVSVDAYSALKEHTDEYIYSRTDHHWQPIGAYYAAEAFAKTAMVDFAPLSSYEEKKKTGFVGTLYGFSGEAQLEQNPDDFIYYLPQNQYTTYNYDRYLQNKTNGLLIHEYASGTNTYSMFLGDDKHVVQVDTDVKNGRTLVVFKDSFGNALIPFLTGSFEHIYVVDYRYCEFNAVDFCTDVKATDVLFATSMFTCTAKDKVGTFEENRVK